MGNSVAYGASENFNIAGYQITHIIPHSPADKAGLSVYFDFIIELDDISVTTEDREFFLNYVSKSVEQPIKMQVFSTKTMTKREVSLTPSKQWGGTGLMGCTIRYEIVKNAIENSWHVLSVSANSAAQKAGLKECSDFIVGYDKTLFEHSNHLQELIGNIRRTLTLLVYNLDTDTFRYVFVDLDASKSIGMDIGNGYLHQIPVNKQANPITRTSNTYMDPRVRELEADYITVIDNRYAEDDDESCGEKSLRLEYVSAMVKPVSYNLPIKCEHNKMQLEHVK
jgi:hypothetical protein